MNVSVLSLSSKPKDKPYKRMDLHWMNVECLHKVRNNAKPKAAIRAHAAAVEQNQSESGNLPMGYGEVEIGKDCTIVHYLLGASTITNAPGRRVVL